MHKLEENPVYLQSLDRQARRLAELPEVERLRGKTLMITGSTGQLGVATVNLAIRLSLLAGLDMRIMAAARSLDGLERRFGRKALACLTYQPYEAMEPFECSKQVDFAIHCAGYGDPRAFAEDPVGVIRANIYGLDSLLSFIGRQKTGRVLFVSSGEIYGQGAPDVRAFDECYCGVIDTMNPRSCYQMAKKAGESLCSSFCSQQGVEVVVARQCHVFGPGHSSRDSRVTAQFINAVADGEPVVMKSPGSQVRSYLHELDAASSYLFLLMRGVVGQAYNVAPSYETSIKQLAEALCRAGGVELRTEATQEDREQGWGGIARSVLSPAKINALGWREAMTFEEAVDITVRSLER